MGETRETIAAVVVTYNRRQLLGECVDALLGQTHPLEALYIIDNGSTDGTCEFLAGKGLISPPERQGNQPVETVRPGIRNPQSTIRNSAMEVHYVRMPANTGSAGGFAEGMQRAAGAGFEWLWLMDDDLLASPDALAALVRKKEELQAGGHGPFVLNSLVIARDQPDSDVLAFPLHEITARGHPRMSRFHWRLSDVRGRVRDGLYEWICPFNGTFVPALAVETVGLPNRELFIHGEEREYRCRLARAFRLYTVVDSRVVHPPHRFGHFDWKQYYNIRNMFIVNGYCNLTALRNLKLIVVSLIRGARHGRWGVKLALRGIRDGLAGRLGKRDDLP